MWPYLIIIVWLSTTYIRSVALIPEEPEDMWHAYNLIHEGDNVRSTTIRKVQNETATGSSSSSRIRTTLTISVESIDFDTQACVLRLKGRNVEENQYVKVKEFCKKKKKTKNIPIAIATHMTFLFFFFLEHLYRWAHIIHSIWSWIVNFNFKNRNGIQYFWNASIWPAI